MKTLEQAFVLRQIVFFVWLTLSEHKWVVSRDRRSRRALTVRPPNGCEPPPRRLPAGFPIPSHDSMYSRIPDSSRRKRYTGERPKRALRGRRWIWRSLFVKEWSS